MLWNQDCLFLHIPKTAGKSLTKAFALTLPRPIWALVSKGQFRELEDVPPEGLFLEEGRGHENISQANAILRAKHGKAISSFKTIVVAVRNPYDLMVSNYFFMRETFRNNQERRNFQIAMESNFEEFTERVGFQNIEKWLSSEGVSPDQLFLIRFEHLQDDFHRLMNRLGLAPIDLPHLNASRHEHYSSYLTDRAEKAIYEKFQYLFDNGFYDRSHIPSMD